MRKIINASVAYHKAMRLEPFIRDLCDEYLDPVIRRGRGDLVADFVVSIPVNVIAHLIGVPRDDWQRFWRWSDEVVEGTYPTLYRTERGEGQAGAHPEFTVYVDALIGTRRRGPCAPRRYSHPPYQDRGRGAEPVRRSHTDSTGVPESSPATRRLGTSSPTCWLPWPPVRTFSPPSSRTGPLSNGPSRNRCDLQPPIHLLLRNVATDTTALGPAMCEGEKIVFGLASANRDESVHADPNEFLLDRPNWREHVAFGGGPHVCPGLALARLEAKVVLETILDRVHVLEVEAGWVWRKTPVFWGNVCLTSPVRLSGH